jgi:hypothetical protein
MTEMKANRTEASAATAKAFELRSERTPSAAFRSRRSRTLSASVLILGLLASGRGAYSQAEGEHGHAQIGQASVEDFAGNNHVIHPEDTLNPPRSIFVPSSSDPLARLMAPAWAPTRHVDNTLPSDFAVVMAPSDQQESWWYWGKTANDVGNLLTQNKARLTEIIPYIDPEGSLKFAVTMAPDDQQKWWWYWGKTGDDVLKLLQQNGARPTQISPYIDVDGALKFTVIMVADDQQKWWWYWGETGDDVGKLITQNKAKLTQFTPYIDPDGALKFVIIMAPDDQQGWWWYWGKTANDVGDLLTQNGARPTQISPYADSDGALKFAVLMAPDDQQRWWWYWGKTANGVGNLLTQNKARLTGLALVAGAATPSQLGSGANYIVGNDDCTILKDIRVTIEITDDLVVSSTVTSGGEPTSKGFAFQLNANSSAMPKSNPQINANNWIVWQQYILGVGPVIQGAINNWTAPSLGSGNQTVNSPAVQVGPALAEVARIPKGYKLTFTLTTDKDTGNVTAVTFEVDDGKTKFPPQTQVLTEVGATPLEVAPIVDFELNLVGPGDLAHTQFLSGAGTITYSASTALNALPAIPGCAGSNTTTGETSNSVYGLVPAGGYQTFVQNFSVSK